MLKRRRHHSYGATLLQRIQRYAPQVVLLAVVLMGILGAIAFYLALRPCVIAIEPGQVAHFEVTKTIFSEAMDDAEEQAVRREQQKLTLLTLESGGLAALVVDPGGERCLDLRLVELKRTGQIFLKNGDVTHNYGPSVGYFDFNLMAFANGLDQAGDAEVHYSHHRRRSARPAHTFAAPTMGWCRVSVGGLSAIEWIDRVPPSMPSLDGERHVQMQDMAMTYAFDTSRGIWESGELEFFAGVETPTGRIRHRVEVRLELKDIERLEAATLAEARRSVLALTSLQEHLAAGRYAGVDRVLGAAAGFPCASGELWQSRRNDLASAAQPGDFLVQAGSVRSSAAANGSGFALADHWRWLPALLPAGWHTVTLPVPSLPKTRLSWPILVAPLPRQ